jgi:hypothetical protein
MSKGRVSCCVAAWEERPKTREERGKEATRRLILLSPLVSLGGCVWVHRILEDRAAMVHGSNTFLATPTHKAPDDTIKNCTIDYGKKIKSNHLAPGKKNVSQT